MKVKFFEQYPITISVEEIDAIICSYEKRGNLKKEIKIQLPSEN